MTKIKDNQEVKLFSIKEDDFVNKINQVGGNVYIVGGWIRDFFLKRKPKDKDYVVCQIKENDFLKLFPQAKRIGKSFPVYLLYLDGKKSEIAFARYEKKRGKGYNGFMVDFNPLISIKDDLKRRDTTINSIAYHLPKGKIIDPFKGKRDLKNKVIKANSYHFSEDPIRALRAARQSCELDFKISFKTILAMKKCQQELSLEPKERIFNELKRALSSKSPEKFFLYLKRSNLLEVTFPEIYHLKKDDNFYFTLSLLKQGSVFFFDISLRFAILTCQMKEEDLLLFKNRLNLPKIWYKKAQAMINLLKLIKENNPSLILSIFLILKKDILPLFMIKMILNKSFFPIPQYLINAELILTEFKNINHQACPLKGKDFLDWLNNQYQEIIKKYDK